MANPRLLVFDSGIGGFSILKAIRQTIPEANVTYLADDAGFPYGDWSEAGLSERIVQILDKAISLFMPHCIIIACNTASTLVLPVVRSAFDVPFVGTVPAIKPAAEQTKTGLISILATPGTVRRDYTFDLIKDFAPNVRVNLVGAVNLAALAEQYVREGSCDEDALRAEIMPCFTSLEGQKTDTIVLGCTHYPFLLEPMKALAPWPVNWVNPAPAIARRVDDILQMNGLSDWKSDGDSIYTTTSGCDPEADIIPLVRELGLLPRHFRQISAAFKTGS